MKRIVMIGLSVCISTFSSAQRAGEWFNQKKTQVKYLIEQIAALQVYIGYVKKGYNIASTGLGAIRKIKQGDFDLHSDHFNSLNEVNPTIRKYSRVAEITAMQASIIKKCHSALSPESTRLLSTEEVAYINKVHDHLLSECAIDIDLLLMLVTDGELEMKDDERIKRIERVYETMKDKFTFVQSFSNKASLLVMQRSKELTQVNASRKIHGLP